VSRCGAISMVNMCAWIFALEQKKHAMCRRMRRYHLRKLELLTNKYFHV